MDFVKRHWWDTFMTSKFDLARQILTYVKFDAISQLFDVLLNKFDARCQYLTPNVKFFDCKYQILTFGIKMFIFDYNILIAGIKN